MVPRSVCDCWPARAIMENSDWFIDMVLFRLGAVTSSCASSPSLKRSGTSNDTPRASFLESLRFLLTLRPILSPPLSWDAILGWGVVSLLSTAIGSSRLLADVLAEVQRVVKADKVDSGVYCELLLRKVSFAAGQLGRSLKVTYWSVEGMTCRAAQ
jgi:hypothetical protein